MTIVEVEGAHIFCRIEGIPQRPPIVFVNSLGTDLQMWDRQVPAVVDQLRVVRYDGRGHGRSVCYSGGWSFDRLAADLIALLDAFKLEAVYLCGSSFGGMVALSMAARSPQRVLKAILANTAARIGTPSFWDARIESVRRSGVGAVRETVLERFFTDGFRARHPALVERFGQTMDRIPRDDYIATCTALRDTDLTQDARRVTSPVLVIGGTEDTATSPDDVEHLHRLIAGSRLVMLEGAAHLANVEQAERFNGAMKEFLEL